MRRRHAAAAARATTYKLCSLLLQYPDDEILDAREDMRAAALELPDSAGALALRRFCEWLLAGEIVALQQHYVETFDLDKRCGLYLSFYGEGDRRQRGMALLRLKRMYRAAGLPLDGTELPDFLPVMLEFAAAAPEGRGEIVLREHRAALELLRHSLHDRGTRYGDVLDAICQTLGSFSAADRARIATLASAGPPQELVGLEPFAPPELMPSTEGRR